MLFKSRAFHFQAFHRITTSTSHFYIRKPSYRNRHQSRSQHSRQYPEAWMHEYTGWEFWTEDLSKYEQGVYYAVHLGDEFGEGRYKVLHKLGNGVSSQLWLARDQRSRGHGYVALKIVPAGRRETKILKQLAAQLPSRQEEEEQHRPGCRYIMRLLDHIPISERNGSSYDCLVLEIVGSDLFSLLKSNGALPCAQAKRASAQVARGLAYIHDLKICHGDLHSKNICFAMNRIRNASEDKILSLLGSPCIRPIRRQNARPLPPTLPKYTVRPSPFDQATGDLKLVDFGQAFHCDEKPEHIDTAYIIKAPELLIFSSRDGWDYRIDLWALGCFIWEVFVGQPPFRHVSPEGLLWEMTRMLGELPPELRGEVDPGKYSDSGNGPSSLEQQLRIDYNRTGRGDMISEDLDQLASILRRLMILDPRKRASASEIADHPWLIETNGPL